MSNKKTPTQKKIKSLKKSIKRLEERNRYLDTEVLRHEMRQDYERPPFRFNFRETVRRSVEILLIPTLLAVIYYSVK